MTRDDVQVILRAEGASELGGTRMTRYDLYADCGDVVQAQMADDGEWVLYADIGNCGNCAHANHEDASEFPTLTYCTRKGGHYNGKCMERTSRCAAWEATA